MAIVLAYASLSASLTSAAVTRVFAASAGAEPSSHFEIASHGIQSAKPLFVAGDLGTAIALVLGFAFLVYAGLRARPTVSAWVSGPLCFILVLLTLALDWSVAIRGPSGSFAGFDPLFPKEAEFEPEPVRGVDGLRLEFFLPVQVLVSHDGLRASGKRFPLSEAGLKEALVHHQQQNIDAISPRAPVPSIPEQQAVSEQAVSEQVEGVTAGDQAPGLRGVLDALFRAPSIPPVVLQPALSVAVDRRATADDLQALVDAAAAAGYRSLAIFGPEAQPARVPGRASNDLAIPALKLPSPSSDMALDIFRNLNLLRPASAIRVLLPAAVPDATAEADPKLLRGEVGTEPIDSLEQRGGRTRSISDLRIERLQQERRGQWAGFASDLGADAEQHDVSIGFLRLRSTTSLSAALRSASRVLDAGIYPVFIFTEIPGSPERPTARWGGLAGLGSMGLVGLGQNGYGGGIGYGKGDGTLADAAGHGPQGRSGEVEPRGSLDKEVIRGVIGRHVNKTRFCFEKRLSVRPELEGRVLVRFAISRTGRVQHAKVTNTTLEDREVESCLLSALRGFTFPAPKGDGVVLVNYPFVFSSR